MNVQELKQPIDELDLKMRALDHECPFLIEKLLKECIVETQEEAEALFTEVKKYLIMVQLEPEKSWQMYSLRVDEVWHQFVLYTREYVDFCLEYFDHYVHHVPSNAPVEDTKDEVAGEAGAETRPIPTFEEFSARYQELFDMPISTVWLDETSVNLDRRVVNYHADLLQVVNGEDGMIDLAFIEGNHVLMTVDELARDALSFIARTGAFYVRELPGELEHEEKIGLVAVLVESKALRVAP